jgi:hypothetical protein
LEGKGVWLPMVRHRDPCDQATTVELTCILTCSDDSLRKNRSKLNKQLIR